MMSTTTRLFEPVFENLFCIDDGLIELRALPGKDQGFVAPDDSGADYVHPSAGRPERSVFGVAARRDSTSGRLENCSFVRATIRRRRLQRICQHDRRVEAHRRVFPEADDRHQQRRRLHVYWILRDRVDIRVQRDLSAFRDVLRRTARALNGDLASAEAARVLRVPGTLNHKYDPPALVTIKADSDARYTLDDFEFLPPEPEPERHRPRPTNGNGTSYSPGDRLVIVERARKYLAAIPPAIQGSGGDRHTYTTCCKLVRDFGLTEVEALVRVTPCSECLVRSALDGARITGRIPECSALWRQSCRLQT